MIGKKLPSNEFSGLKIAPIFEFEEFVLGKRGMPRSLEKVMRAEPQKPQRQRASPATGNGPEQPGNPPRAEEILRFPGRRGNKSQPEHTF